ncbi:MAG TPA: MCE family protein [Planctomycetes bacterium]|nr:MCE family protein [Planctomycetota bacterium]
MSPEGEPIEVANLRPVRRLPVGWFLLGLGAFLTAFIAWSAWRERGPSLVLFAPEGAGLGPGDALRYRGIRVGSVERVALAQDLERVEVRVRLDPASESLARAGSRFWIVRPRIGLDRLEGLETLFGARYVAVLPGPLDGPIQREFVCLPDPPVDSARGEGGIEFVLEAPRRMGIGPRAPLTYREVEVGRVLSVALSSDARGVEIWCQIDAPYRELLRTNTVFWRSGGFRFGLELLDGLSLDVDSLRTLLGGGIALATPDLDGSPARTGARFPLAEAAPDDAQRWAPPIPLGAALVAPGTPPVPLQRARLTFEEGFFGRDRERTGWLLAVEPGLLGPMDLLELPEDSEGAALEVHGERHPILNAPERAAGGGALREIRFSDLTPWPSERVRTLGEPEDCVVVGGPAHAALAISAARLSPREAFPGSFRIDPSISFESDLHGAAVLAREDGMLVGILRVRGGRGVLLAVEDLVRR